MVVPMQMCFYLFDRVERVATSKFRELHLLVNTHKEPSLQVAKEFASPKGIRKLSYDNLPWSQGAFRSSHATNEE